MLSALLVESFQVGIKSERAAQHGRGEGERGPVVIIVKIINHDQNALENRKQPDDDPFARNSRGHRLSSDLA